MKCFFLIAGLVFVCIMQAQTEAYFHFTAPKEKVSNSLYNDISFLDSRTDTANLGHVYAGLAKRHLPVLPQIDLYTQCNWLFKYLTSSTAKKHRLLFQLRKLEFDERPYSPRQQTGTCALRADLYYTGYDKYYFIARLDTLIYNRGDDVTLLLFENTTDAIVNFLKQNITGIPAIQTPYAYHEILSIDSVEKSKAPLYNANSLTEGVYMTFESFKKQTPDFKIKRVDLSFGEIKGVVTEMFNGKEGAIIATSKIYAFVYDGRAYITHNSKSRGLQKEGSDLYLTDYLMVPPVNLGLDMDMLTAIHVGTDKLDLEKQLNGPREALYKIKVDPVDGSFITIKKFIR